MHVHLARWFIAPVVFCTVIGATRIQAQPAPAPKLVVVLVVDQMRADYVDRYGHQWTRGLRRLLDRGASFTRASFPYLNTFTCVGHATVSTGALPSTHGIVGNGWFDRESGRTVRCSEDTSVETISYNLPVKGGNSTARLLVPTLADELRTQLPGPTRIATFSMKERTAIMLVGRLGRASVDALNLGRGPGVDFLGISFSALDLVGHDFGPTSHEVQDVLVRLDDTIGTLLDHLDRVVGKGRYVVALTGDHGVSPIPEQVGALGLDAGRLPTSTLTKAAAEALQRAIGPGTYQVCLSNSELYLDVGVVNYLRSVPTAVASALRELRALPGVADAYFAESLDAHAAAGDEGARAALASYVPGRSGDIVVLTRPYWFYVTADGSVQPGSATTHGLLYGYDQRVPLALYGAGVKPVQFLRQVTPVDIAPTLAYLCGITLPRPDGEVLIEALATPAAAPARAPGR